MAAQTYVTCTCGHKDIAHGASVPHPCRVRDCDCPCFISQRVAAKVFNA